MGGGGGLCVYVRVCVGGGWGAVCVRLCVSVCVCKCGGGGLTYPLPSMHPCTPPTLQGKTAEAVVEVKRLKALEAELGVRGQLQEVSQSVSGVADGGGVEKMFFWGVNGRDLSYFYLSRPRPPPPALILCCTHPHPDDDDDDDRPPAWLGPCRTRAPARMRRRRRRRRRRRQQQGEKYFFFWGGGGLIYFDAVSTLDGKKKHQPTSTTTSTSSDDAAMPPSLASSSSSLPSLVVGANSAPSRVEQLRGEVARKRQQAAAHHK